MALLSNQRQRHSGGAARDRQGGDSMRSRKAFYNRWLRAELVSTLACLQGVVGRRPTAVYIHTSRLTPSGPFKEISADEYLSHCSLSR